MSTSMLIPKLVYTGQTFTIDATNNKFQFKDAAGGATLTATIASSSANVPYNFGELCYQLVKAMTAAGVAKYTARYSLSTLKFTISSDLTGGATAFQIITGGANDAAPTFGFTSNQTGASSYTGTAVPAATTLTFTQVMRGPQPARSFDREDVVLEYGASESISFGNVGLFSFRVDYETGATIQGLDDLMQSIGGIGGVVKLYPDSTVASYVDVVLIDKDVRYREMSAEGFYGLYSVTFQFRVANPNSGDLTLRSLLSRGP